ncbi:hypothetical protein SAMD00019534_072580 [Acytostelium subglobosum LB1]|uniref:hypothetical protein n=1 Tax=Acytostelium subglobosum LB1 TaxID=1410327 RepID=UPI0006451862|nr:hypothetical protein SAMD00019534_072580 [Acytostelium subglobosum LB1]GAM24083.1 hypothetical protein SAMD00019534_072580 [Acytostelium subglobosum LB1]|eukprot:XP_012753119.1 hypothetical protein SAMD00019534_072580 [Acytostelium subglobosum LB1]
MSTAGFSNSSNSISSVTSDKSMTAASSRALMADEPLCPNTIGLVVLPLLLLQLQLVGLASGSISVSTAAAAAAAAGY